MAVQGSLVPAEGRLLVASPAIGDPNFARTVVGLLEHDDEVGTLGVVLNRPTELAVDAALPQWGSMVTGPPVLFVGGPVAEGSALGLARVDGDASTGWTEVFDRMALVDLEHPPDDGEVSALRIYTGYAGWGIGQLRAELREGSWWVFDSRPEDWFSVEPEILWETVLRRQGGLFRMWADAPEDPVVN